MVTIRAHFDGKVFVPDEPVDMAVGEPASVTVDARPSPSAHVPPPAPPDPEYPLRSFVEWAAKLPPLPDSPGDAAAQHDHYPYGTPKRENP